MKTKDSKFALSIRNKTGYEKNEKINTFLKETTLFSVLIFFNENITKKIKNDIKNIKRENVFGCIRPKMFVII